MTWVVILVLHGHHRDGHVERKSGLIDERILGSSDYLIALALVHKSHQKYLNCMSDVFVINEVSFEKKCDKHLTKLSFTNVNYSKL